MFRRPHMMYFPPQVGTDAIMRGFLTQNSQSMDSFISAEVTSHLFAEHPPKGFGEDLASLNMQRAREHGIPGRANDWLPLLIPVLSLLRLQLLPGMVRTSQSIHLGGLEQRTAIESY